MNENAWPFAINLLVVPLKLFLILPDVTVPGINLRIAKILMSISGAAYTLDKNWMIYIQHIVLIQVHIIKYLLSQLIK